MSKKPNMLDLIRNLSKENAYEVLNALRDLHDAQGKNAVLVALDHKLYEQAEIMLSPVKKPNKEEYVIFFNPFRNAVTNGTKPLKWPAVPEKMQFLSDYTGIMDTKDSYEDFYSIYSYIQCMDNKEAKDYFTNLVTTIDYELFDKIKIVDLPDPIENRTANVYSSNDIVKYYPLPYIVFITELYNKGIDAKTTLDKNGCGEIIIEKETLSKENQEVVEALIGIGLMSINGSQIVLNLRFNEETTVGDVEMQLERISELFHQQTPNYERIDINKYYENLRKVMERLDVKLPMYPDREEKIRLCRKYNRKLTLNDSGAFFYLHPGVKERIEQANGIKL